MAAPGLANVQADIDITGEDAVVRMDYSVLVDKGDIKAVPLTTLRIAGATIADVHARSAGGADLQVTVKEAGLNVTADVAVPRDFKAGEKLAFVLEYRVKGAVKPSGQQSSAIHVPLLAARWGPVAAVPGTFRATAKMPQGYKWVEGFPTEPSSVTSSDGRAAVTYSMQVMPSMVRAIVTQGPVPFFNTERALDSFAIASLLVVAYLTYYLIIKLPARQQGRA